MLTVRIQCESCGAAVTVEEHLRTAQCPYCDSPAVIDRPPAPDRPDPSFVIGFVIDRAGAVDRARRWLRKAGPFAYAGLRKARLDDVRGIYLPAYLYAAVAHSDYTARIGESYRETELFATTDSEGGKKRIVTDTEWFPLAGRHSTYMLDVVVTASRGIDNAELEAVEPFDLRALKHYAPAMVAGWIAEEPSLGRRECLRLAHDESVAKLEHRIRDFMPGDKHEDLETRIHLNAEEIDLVLLPVWVFAVRYHPERPPARLLINGQTGKLHGKVPIAWWKVGLTVAVVLLLALAATFLKGFFFS